MGWTLLGAFGLAFLIDLAATLTTLIGLERDLRELERIAAALRRGSDAISRNLSDAALAADEKLEEGRDALPAKLAELEVRRDFLRAKLVDSRLFGAGRLMRAFPAMQNLKHSDALAELKAEFKARLPR